MNGRLVRGRYEAPREFAWWWRGAVTAYSGESISLSGAVRDIVGSDRGTVINHTGPWSPRSVAYGRPAMATGASVRNRLLSSNGVVAQRLSTQATVWWYGRFRPGFNADTIADSPSLAALMYDGFDTFPYYCACGISREFNSPNAVAHWNAAGYPNGYALVYLPDLGRSPRLLVNTIDTVTGVRRLYQNGVMVDETTSYGTTPFSFTATSRLRVNGHDSTSLSTEIGVEMFAAGYHNRALSASEIRQWARDPMGPLTVSSRFVPPAPRILRPTLDLGGSGWSAS